jgi:hypothetical protein
MASPGRAGSLRVAAVCVAETEALCIARQLVYVAG